jgi:thiaminase
VITLRSVPDSLWTAATRHPFLDAVREGTIADEAFDRWLVQDSLFVADLLAFQARLLARAPRPAQQVLAAGCLALVDELDWFEVQGAQRALELNGVREPATQAYAELLADLDVASFDDAITALWVLERVYLIAWTSAAPSTAKYAEFVAHWTTPEFGQYVDALAALAIPDGRDDLIASVLSQEVAFWDMAMA